MPSVGFEPMIPVFEPAKTVHALDHAATVITWISTIKYINICIQTRFAERIRVVMQFKILCAAQCMPTGIRHRDISIEKNICRLFGKSITKFTRVLKGTVC
jgi:hypothetical protein